MNNSKWSKLNKFHFGAVDYEETFDYSLEHETLTFDQWFTDVNLTKKASMIATIKNENYA